MGSNSHLLKNIEEKICDTSITYIIGDMKISDFP